jgi:thiol-disulfide isomerase/thioredoxin
MPSMTTIRLKTRLAAVTALIALGAALAGCTAGDDRVTELPGPVADGAEFRAVPSPAAVAPDGDLTLLDGDHVTVSELSADRPVVLVFVEPWCTDCAEGEELLGSIAAKYHGVVTVVGIAHEGSVDELRDYARKNDVGHLLARDETGAIWESYGVEEAPFSVMIAEGGTLLRGWRGLLPDLGDAIDALLVKSLPEG